MTTPFNTRVPRPVANKLKPVQLISFDHNKNLTLNEQAVQLLHSFEQKTKQLAIIAVVGRYRTGKSYILNRVLLNQSSGFEVGPTINACTKGLWVWPELVEMVSSTGQKRQVMLMDTEGLGSLEEGENTDTKIFLMSTLLSSFMVYNSVGSIDEKAIQGLGLIVNLSKMLQKSSNSENSQELVNCFPSFLWLVRDFYLRLQNQEGETINSTEYLENALKMQKGRPEAIDSKNAIRAHLRQYFRDRDCFTLIRPTSNDVDLQYLNTVPENRLRPEFVLATKKLKSLICDRVRPKSFRNKPCSPTQFIEMARHFISAINSGGIPSISSHWESVCSSESNRIISMFEKRHTSEIQDALIKGSQLPEIEKIHWNVLNQGQKKIDETFLPALEKQLKKKALRKTLKGAFESIRKQLVERSFQLIKASLQQTFLTLLQDVRTNKSESFDELCEKLEGVRVDDEKCIASPNNQQPQLHLELYERMKNLSGEFIGSMQDKWRLQNQMLKEKEQFCQATFHQRRIELQDQLEYQQQKLRNFEALNYRQSIRIDSLTEDKANLEQQLQQERNSVEILEKDIIRAARQAEEILFQKQNEVNDLTGKLNRVIQSNDQEIAEKSAWFEDKLKAKENEKSGFEKKCKDLQSEIETLKVKVDEMQCQLLISPSSNNSGPAFNNNKLLFLTKQNQELTKELCNQKNMNQSLVRSLQPQSSTVSFLNQIRTLQCQNEELSVKIRQLKLYQHTVLSCSQFRCQKCEGLFRFDQLSSHPCEKDWSIDFDVSFMMDNFTKEIVFVVEITRGDKTWRLDKSVKVVNLMLRRFGEPELRDLHSAEGCEGSRIRIAEFFEGVADICKTDPFLIEFLAVDLHSTKVRKKVLRQRPKLAETRKFSKKCKTRRLHTEVEESLDQGEQLFIDSKLCINQQQELENINHDNLELDNRSLLKTCKFDMKKHFMFPS